MKKLLLFAIAYLTFFAFGESKAQVRVNVNIGTPPVYVAPAPAEVSYYYLPDVEAYYYVPAKRYYYLHGDRWVAAAYLPGRYREYDVYRVRHIPVYESRPYLRHDYYHKRYKGHGGGKFHHGKGGKGHGNKKKWD